MFSSRACTPALALMSLTASVVVLGASQTTPTRPPAPTLTRPALPTKAVDAAGFVRRWLVLEPIPATGQLTQSAVRAVLATEHFPDQLTTVPRDGDRVTVGGTPLTWHAVDTTHYNVNLYHFAYALNKPTSNVLFWAVTVVTTPTDLTNVRLAIGSNAASVWWVNGEEVIGIYNDRQAVIDDGVSRRLTMKRGANVIRAAVFNGGGATDFCARFLDANDRPVRTLAVALPAAGK